MTDSHQPVAPGQPAPNFQLPAIDRPETVSLADYRGRSPLFLALMVGLWCPFCRRHIAQMGPIETQLKTLGVETLGYLSLDGMLRAAGGNPTEFCHACFSGNYPTEIPDDVQKARHAAPLVTMAV